MRPIRAAFVVLLFVAAAARAQNGVSYHFDEGGGTTAFDSSGAGNHGTIVGATYVTGHSGTALHFSNPGVDRVNVPISVFNGFGNTVYLEAWVRPNAYPAGGGCTSTIFRKRSSNNDFEMSLQSGGRVVCNLYGSGTAVGVSAGSAALNSWSKTACYYDGFTMHAYINDVEVGQQTLALTPNWTGGNPVTQIGNDTTDFGINCGDYSFHGDIDDVRLATSNAAACSLTLTAPNGGEVWPSGSLQNITWSRSGSGCASTLTIELLKGGVLNDTISNGAIAGNNLFTHTVLSKYVNGSDYKIRIRDNNTGVSSTSANNFSITGSPSGQPVISSFTVNPSTISAGSAATLSWTTSNATSVTIDNGIGSVTTSGSRTVAPGFTTTYTLTASGSGGAASAQTTLIVGSAGCVPSSTVVCLNNNRFSVRIDWRTSGGQTGQGQAIKYTDASALFWFFGSDNIEVLLKVLNACSLSNTYWVFSAATTDVEYTIYVTDTQRGTTKTYFHAGGTPAPAITDTGAFATCP